MIKANELRIGNLIEMPANSGKPFWKLLEIKEHGVIYGLGWETGTAYCKYDIPNPIPLTPEWLERCGLIKAIKEPDDSWQTWGNPHIDIAMAEGGFVLFIRDVDGYYGQIVGKPMQYLHQLQNLYFALTGEELNGEV